MRYIVFSDIHSNLEAFDKMLSLKKSREADKFIFLGDLVGYGPDPNATIDLFQELSPMVAIRGNHDKVVAGLESSSLFNPVAAFSAEWSKLHISDNNLNILKKLPKGPQVIDRCLSICHGSTFDEDYYIFSTFEALESFKFIDTPIGFFGHTHYPIIYFLRNDRIDTVPLKKTMRIKLDINTKYFINPGSIGQPRDKNPQPSYIMYDSDKREIFFVRFSYNFKVTQSKIRGAGLPEILASRIELGV